MTPLDHRAQRVLADMAAARAPDDAYTDAMRAYYEHQSGQKSDLCEIICTIRQSRLQSEILEALLLSNCPEQEIFDALAVPVQASCWYAELFFDTAVFKTGLDRIEYLEEYPDSFGRDVKMKAVSLGYEFVLFTYANLVPKTAAQKKLVERMFMATSYKAMAMNYNGIKSDVSKQAVRHAELMMRAYDLLVKTNADETNSNYDLVTLLATEDTAPAAATAKPQAEDIL